MSRIMTLTGLIVGALLFLQGACTDELTPVAPTASEDIAPRVRAHVPLGTSPPSPAVRFRITAENLTVDPDESGDPGLVGDRLRVDVEGPSLRELTGTALFRNALGEETRLTITSSGMIGGELALYDDGLCPTGASEVITILLEDFRVFTHRCDGTTTSVFNLSFDSLILDINAKSVSRS